MPTICAVVGCKNRSKNRNGIQFFQFPLNRPKLLNQWLIVLDRKGWTPKPSSRICSEHFSKKAFIERSKTSFRLKPNAVPSVFPNVHCILHKGKPLLILDEGKRNSFICETDGNKNEKELNIFKTQEDIGSSPSKIIKFSCDEVTNRSNLKKVSSSRTESKFKERSNIIEDNVESCLSTNSKLKDKISENNENVKHLGTNLPNGSPTFNSVSLRKSQRTRKNPYFKMNDFVLSSNINNLKNDKTAENNILKLMQEKKDSKNSEKLSNTINEIHFPNPGKDVEIDEKNKWENRSENISYIDEKELDIGKTIKNLKEKILRNKVLVDLSKNNDCVGYLENFQKELEGELKEAQKERNDITKRSNKDSEFHIKLTSSEAVKRNNNIEIPTVNPCFKSDPKEPLQPNCEDKKIEDKGSDENVLYKAFIKFIRAGGLKSKTEEEKELDRMSRRIADTIKHMKLLNQVDGKTKKLTVLITSLPRIDANEIIILKKKNKLTNKETDINLHVEMSSNTFSYTKSYNESPEEKINNLSDETANDDNCKDFPECDISPVTVEIPFESSENSETVDIPLPSTYVESIFEDEESSESLENISSNLCHDHNYTSSYGGLCVNKSLEDEKTNSTDKPSLESSLCSLDFSTSDDILFKTKAFEKINEFKINIKNRNEIIRRLKERIKLLQSKFKKINKEKKIKHFNQNRKKVKNQKKSKELFVGSTALLAESLDIALTQQSIDEEDSEEESQAPYSSPIRYFCEPVSSVYLNI